MHENFIKLFESKSPKMYYNLGLIFGDGCVHYSEKTHKYYVNLTSEDLDILNNFKDFLSVNSPIKQIRKTKAFGINIWSKPLCIILYDLFGLRNKKSNKLVYPDIPPEMERFFIIGLHATDGSNCINTRKKKYKDKVYIYRTLEWNYTSCSLEFIQKVNDVISRNLDISPAKVVQRKHKKGSISYCIKYMAKRGELVCNWMYDCPKFMICKRKFAMYKEYELYKSRKI